MPDGSAGARGNFAAHSACDHFVSLIQKDVHPSMSSSTPQSSPIDAREISIAHSPDSDDAFMFYALATNKVRVPGLKFTHTLCDIETLNRQAQEGDGVYDVTAIS